MSKKELHITPPDGWEIDKEKSTFEHIIFKPIPKIARNWHELEYVSGSIITEDSRLGHVEKAITQGNTHKNVFPSDEYAEAALALAQLLQLRQRIIGNWKPNWYTSKNKYCIIVRDSNIEVSEWMHIHFIFSFPKRNQAVMFLNNHQTLLETAKPLL